MWEGIPESGAAWLRTRPLNETWVRLLAVPFGGGVLVGLLNTMRHSLDNDIENDEPKAKAKSPRLDDLRGILRAFLKAMGAAVTLGTGCSLGPEGPSVEIGASIANGVGTVLSNSRERKLSLVAAGSAAGISSGLFTPMLPTYKHSFLFHFLLLLDGMFWKKYCEVGQFKFKYCIVTGIPFFCIFLPHMY